MKTTFFSIVFVMACCAAHAQTTLRQGEIIFEKKFNTHAYPDFKSISVNYNLPQFRSHLFSLRFDASHNYYGAVKNDNAQPRLGEQAAEDNDVWVDVIKKAYVSRKRVFDQKFVVADSLPVIDWKITGERKVIAGLDCRRANAVIFDSIYVVAFYTESIASSAGPELFSGLPGMILSVSLPHEHISWTATKVTSANEPVTPFKPALNSINRENLKQQLSQQQKLWGEHYNLFLAESLL